MKIAGMILRKNEEVQNCWGIEKGRFSGNCKDDFETNSGWNREVKID